MSAAYTAADWESFFVASAGAAAALAGLVFVGISINLQRILTVPGLPARAGETIIVLANALAISLIGLAPGLHHVGLGLLVLAVGGAALASVVVIGIRTTAPDDRRHTVNSIVLKLLGTLAFPVAGLSILVQWGGGLYWILAGVVLALLVGLANGWVLLVEILR